MLYEKLTKQELLFLELEKNRCLEASFMVKIDAFSISRCTFEYDSSGHQVAGFCDIAFHTTAYSLFDNFPISIHYYTENKKTSDLVQYHLQPGVICRAEGSLVVSPDDSTIVSLFGSKFYPIPENLIEEAQSKFDTA